MAKGKASGGSTKKNAILIGVIVVLLAGAVMFGFKETLFPPKPEAEASEAAAASDAVAERITGGQKPTVEPDPPGPAVEPGSGRRARDPSQIP